MKLYDANGLQKSIATPAFPGQLADSPAAAVNNYSPPGWVSSIQWLLITPASGGTVLTGLDSSVHQVGDSIVLSNEAPTVTDQILFANASGSSLSANRFVGVGGEDYLLLPGSAVQLLLSASGWRFVQ